jgi:hypothetical protein
VVSFETSLTGHLYRQTIGGWSATRTHHKGNRRAIMSQRDSGYARRERDFYETPAWVTEALCNDLVRSGWALGCVWEPAAGNGKMLDVLKRYADPGRAVGTDINPLRPDIGKGDFLAADFPSHHDGYRGFGGIVTNPPYDLATEFVERALRLFEGAPLGKIAMLMRTDFDHAKSRAHIFRDCPAFQKKLVLTRRIVWFEPEPGSKGKSPSFNHAWFIWDRNHAGPATLGYA